MRSAILLLAPFAVVAIVHAESITTGSIRGVVRDSATHQPIPGVLVTAGPLSAITDGDGAYEITQLVPGTYDVVFEADLTKVVHRGVEVGVDNVTTLFQELRRGDVIEVHGTPPPIKLPSTAHEIRIGRPELEGVPQRGPTFESAIDGIGGSQNDGLGNAFSGSSSLENRYIVDGVDITGLTLGNVGTPVLNEFIQEIEVITGGYNAEYGRSTGGIVNMVTRSGTDQLRGSIFGVVQPSFLAAHALTAPRNASSIDVTSDRASSGNIGFEVGGPIVKGKAWFYVGVSPQLSRTDYTRITKRESDCRTTLPNGQLSRCDPANADGSPDLDPKTGFYLTDELDRDVRTASSRSTSMLGKITAAIDESNQAQLSLIAQPSSSETPGLYGLPTSGRRSSGLTTDAAARWTSKLNDGKTEVEALVAWHRSTLDSGSLDPTLDATPLQSLYDGNLGQWSALGGESPATVAGCRDGGAGDLYPNIPNCPMQSQSYTIGGPGALQHDREERRVVQLGVTQRGRLAGTHEIKAGLQLENDLKELARLYSGGATILNDVNGGTVTVNRWVALAAPGDSDPRFDHTCATPNPNSASGDRMSGSLSFRCDFLGGSLGAPNTQIAGETANWGAYLRDSWQPISNLTLNAGVRYEEQRLRYASSLRGTIDPLTGNVYGDNAMVLRGNFAPRLGATYDPTHEGRSKLYAHWGRFYESIPMDINDRSFGGEVSDQRIYTARDCGPIDPRIGGTDGAKCLTSPTGQLSEQLLGSRGVLVAPGIQAEYLDEVIAGAEVAVLPDVVLGLMVQHRQLGRVIEDMSTDGANTYIIANPGEWSAGEEKKLAQQIARTGDPIAKQRLEHQLELFKGIRIFDKPVRDYNAVELSLSRKFAPGLYVQGSYTYSRTEGNYPGSVSYDNGQVDPNISSQYDLVELLANRRGPLPQDRPHSVKLDGYYAYRASSKDTLTFGARIRMISGSPENALGSHYLYGADESFLLPRGELGRSEIEHGLDVHLSYKRKLTNKTSAELYVDVFNVYNRQGTYGVDNTYAPQYKLAGAGQGGELQNANPISGGTYADLIWLKEVDKLGYETAQPIGRNPNFGNPIGRYAPASAQVGFRVTF